MADKIQVRECPHEGVKYLTRAGLLCFDCTPAEERAEYPGWAEREALKRRQAEQAKLNFAASKPTT